jgi:tetratricopeptide (TPR) repeat protein
MKKKQKKKQPDLVIPAGFWKKNWLPALLLFALPFLFYWQAVNFEFVLDDQIVLSENNYTKKGISGIWDLLTTESMEGYFGEQKDLVAGARYRPLSLVTFAIEYEFFGLSSWVSHFNNMLLYALLGVLLFRVLCILFPQKNPYLILSLSFVAALLFVLHPVHVEVVANVKGRDEIMSLIGSLGTLYFSLRFISSGKAHWLIWSAVTFFLAILSKENAVTFLAVIPLTIWYFSRASWRKIGMATLPIVVSFLVYLVLRYQVIGYLLGADKEITDVMNNPFYGISLGEKLATIFYTLGIYIKLLFFPHPLTHDYYPYHIPIMDWGRWQSLLSLLVHLGLGYLAIRGMRKKTILSYSIWFYLITLSIVSNLLFPIGTFMNDRFIFFSSLGACIVLGYFISRWLADYTGQQANVLNIGLLSLLLLFFSYKTWTRVPDWESPLTLNSSAVKVSRNSARANCMLGTALFEKYKVAETWDEKEVLLEEASFYVNRAVDILPSYGSAQTMKAGVAAELYKRYGDLDQLLEVFYDVLTVKKRLTFVDEFLEYLKNRGDAQKLGNFAYRLGYQYFYKQRAEFDYAYQYLKYGTEVMPGDARLWYWLGRSYEQLGYTEDAQKLINRALQLDPNIGEGK